MPLLSLQATQWSSKYLSASKPEFRQTTESHFQIVLSGTLSKQL